MADRNQVKDLSRASDRNRKKRLSKQKVISIDSTSGDQGVNRMITMNIAQMNVHPLPMQVKLW